MLLSMTGYGKAECPFLQSGVQKKLVVELRGLNSKTMDISMRLSPIFREKELEIRTILTQRLERGKVDCAIYLQDNGGNDNSFSPVNFAAVEYYQKQISQYCQANNQPLPQDWWSLLLRLPDVMRPTEQNEISDTDWNLLQDTLSKAMDAFTAFREQEGLALQRMFVEKLDGIATLLQAVEPYEKERVNKIRTRLEDNLKQLTEATQQAIDKNRLEQEMIFYLEKLDINEEKVRLKNHIQYFRSTMDEQGTGVGKKLGFVAQEMGREINTLGSKSNQAEMQIIVVKMKDILEQIKEQVLNVL